ncbi:MAG: DUF2974 domain-containing protein [Cyanobacteria bacterium RUI128]|nr:DUF2974 domain-containing protein [Cyanobacteria bacterium RUI128]
MQIFGWLRPKINSEFLDLAHIAYGGELYLGLKNHRQKEVNTENTKLQKVTDSLLSQRGNNDFYSYKNLVSGFSANLFENVKTKELVIAYRGTERLGLGENQSDVMALAKDVVSDVKFITSEVDEQFEDSYEFYKLVKAQNPKAKITLTGHSLGGGLVQLAGAKIYSDTKQKVEAYAYNAPGCKHLLEIFGCRPDLNYSFITNYAVMNDWCGMFGENIGKTYLISPIPMNKVETNSLEEVLKNVLFKTHEGIFEYRGKVFKKPDDFNQQEGLSLWYFDENNPVKGIELSEYLNSFAEKFRAMDNISRSVRDTTNDFINEQAVKLASMDIPPNIADQLKKFADGMCVAQTEQHEKFAQMLNNNTINVVSKYLDMTISELTEETLANAKKIVGKLNNNGGVI